jgi:hypothetical protein
MANSADRTEEDFSGVGANARDNFAGVQRGGLNRAADLLRDRNARTGVPIAGIPLWQEEVLGRPLGEK